MVLSILWNEEYDLVEGSKHHPIYQQSILKANVDMLQDTYIVYNNELIISSNKKLAPLKKKEKKNKQKKIIKW